VSAFTGSLQLDFGDWGKDVGRIAITLAPMRWTCTEPGHEVDIEIPAGTMSDGATVPRLLWWFLPPWGDRATPAAVLHDFLCERLDQGHPFPNCDTRARCDAQFRLALIALKIPRWRAWLCWAGVRLYSKFLAP